MICAAFMLLHFGILLTFKLWYFPMLYIAVWLLLYPKGSAKENIDSEHLTWIQKFVLIFPVMITLSVVNVNIGRIVPGFPVPMVSKLVSGMIPLPQYWGFFAPAPPVNNVKFDFFGVKADASQSRILEQSFFTTHRHGVKLLSVLPDLSENYWQDFGKYLCSKDLNLVTVKIEMENHTINLESMKDEPITIDSFSHDCSKEKNAT
jgi:hypothetical protein